MKIDVFNVNVMKAEEDFAYHQAVQGKMANLPLAESVTGYSAGLKAAANTYDEKIKELDKVLKEANSVPSAFEASNKDAARDKSWTIMRNFVKASIYHPDPEVAEIMTSALIYFNRYGDLSKATQLDETGSMYNLLEDLRSMGAAKLAKAGLTPYFNDLEEKNKAFVAIRDIRLDEKGERLTPGLIQKKRKEVDEAYRVLVETTNALVVINGDTPYLGFVKPVNALINEVRATLANRRTTAKKRAEKNPKQPKDPKDPKQPKDPKKPEGGGDDIHTPEEPPKKPEDKDKPKQPETGGGDDIHVPSEPPKKPDGQ